MQSSSASRKRSRTEEHPPSRAAPASRSTSRPQARSHSLFTSADLLLFDQLHARVQFDCPALWSRFDVEKFQLACSQVSALGLHKDGRWVNWQSYASEANVLAFFQHIFDQLHQFIPAGLPVYRFVPSGSVPLKHGDCNRKSDLVFTATSGSLRDSDHRDKERETTCTPSWADVRVIGELKSNPAKSNCDSTVIQLANYVREVFGAQPWRRWVMCFTLCGTEFRVWQFDRGGAVGSTIIDIHSEWALFLTAFLSFASMGATEIGFDPSIRCEINGCEDTFDYTLDACSSDPQRPFLWVPVSMEKSATQNAPRALPTLPPSIAAFLPKSWSKLELQPRTMAPRWAIITRTGICCRARLWGSKTWSYVVKDQWRSPEREPEGNILSQCRCQDATGVPDYLWHADILHPDGTVENIASIRPPFHGPGKTCDAPQIHTLYPMSKHLLHSGCDLLNRVHTRLVIAPIGRSLLQFNTYTELLTALRDAVKGHRHMYLSHDILHRDVSVNNIVILPIAPSAPVLTTGILIDFDLAICTTRDSASHRTGTFDFMAGEILSDSNIPHTPLHDLESFFYVLLWLCIYYGHGGRRRSPEPPETVFVQPKSGSFKAACNAKGCYEKPARFKKRVLPTLAPDALCVKEVLLHWHRLLFREDDDVEVDDVDPRERFRRSYDAVLDVLDRGIQKLDGL
jgi:hypothetical protein